jgi:TRAP-type C4-dicarboxylate transport system substrate-binding protein
LPARFKERTGGRYAIEIYWSDSLVPMFEIMDAVREGAAEMGDWPFGPFASQDIRFASAEMPLSYDSYEAIRQAGGLMLPEYSKIMEEKFNQKGVNCYPIGCLEIGSVNKPIKTVEDMKGLMCQSISPQVAGFLDTFGAAGASISPIEVYQSLEKGIVDSTLQAVGKFDESKLWEVVPYLTVGFLIPAHAAQSINLDVYNKMPKDVQDILVDEFYQLQMAYVDILVERFEPILQKLADNGMEIYYLPKAERDRWVEAIQPFDKSLLDQMGDFGARYQEIADEVNAKYPYPY